MFKRNRTVVVSYEHLQLTIVRTTQHISHLSESRQYIYIRLYTTQIYFKLRKTTLSLICIRFPLERMIFKIIVIHLFIQYCFTLTKRIINLNVFYR